MHYLVDTDTCIYLLKKSASNAVRQFESLTPGDVAISSITIAELFYGAEKSRRVEHNIKSIENFISPLVILPFDKAAAEQYGRIRERLESSGKIIGRMNMLIASVGLANKLTLVTNNVREFKRVPGLKVENWI